jgi:hypothetical protein
MFAVLRGGRGPPSAVWRSLPRVLLSGWHHWWLADDVVAVFVIIGTLAAFFAAYIAVGMVSGMLRCVGGGLLGATDDESQHVWRDPALRMDGLAVEDRQGRSRALVIEQLRQLTLRER